MPIFICQSTRNALSCPESHVSHSQTSHPDLDSVFRAEYGKFWAREKITDPFEVDRGGHANEQEDKRVHSLAE